MKKFFIMAVMAVCSLAANAQTPAAGSVTVVPKVGVNFANLVGDDDVSLDPRYGVAAGAEALYMVSDIFGISAGAVYSQQGTKDNKVKYQIDYVNVPIMANTYVADGLALKIGLQPAFKVSEKLSTKNVSIGNDAIESFDLSIPVGVSYEMANVVLDARYNFGVTDVFKSDILKANNSVFQVTLGYRF